MSRMPVACALALAAAIRVAPAIAQAQYTVREYVDDLAMVVGEIDQVRAWEEVCSQQFPQTMEPNQRAVDRWRAEYAPFVEEMQRRWLQWIDERSQGDTREKDRLVLHFRMVYQRIRSEFHEKLLADGLDLYRKRCENYPRYLVTPSMNLESVHAARLQRIRRYRP